MEDEWIAVCKNKAVAHGKDNRRDIVDSSKLLYYINGKIDQL